MPKAFITGITGQDGSYLAEMLLKKGYQVIGLVSQVHSIGNHNIAKFRSKLILEKGDLLDEQSLTKIITKYKPQEIYNLGGISFIPKSWQDPELTFDINSLGLLRILELIRKISPKSRIFQATSAKIFGDPQVGPQTEKTAIKPISPYGISKTCAHFLIQNYRHHFGLFCCSGIMYNHESERRGVEFVTRKITSIAVKIKLGLEKSLLLGDLEAKQDWGYAPDYVEAMWLMLQQKKADDYLIATGKLHSVKEVCQIAFGYLKLNWREYVKQSKDFLRKEISHNFFGDFSKAKRVLGWQPRVSFKTMIEKMVINDLKLSKTRKIS